MVYGVLGMLNFAYGELVTIAGYSMLAATYLGRALRRRGARRRDRGRHRLGADGADRVPAAAQRELRVAAVHVVRRGPADPGRVPPGRLGPLARHPRAGAVRRGRAARARCASACSRSSPRRSGRSRSWVSRHSCAARDRASRCARPHRTSRRHGCSGVRANRVISLAFLISGLLAGIAGVLWIARTTSVNPTTGFVPGDPGLHRLGDRRARQPPRRGDRRLLPGHARGVPAGAAAGSLLPYAQAASLLIVVAMLVRAAAGPVRPARRGGAGVDPPEPAAAGAVGHGARLACCCSVGMALVQALGSTSSSRTYVMFLVNVMLVVSIQTFIGNSGIVSFGHVAFMGIGAYTTALVTIPEAVKGAQLPELPSVVRDRRRRARCPPLRLSALARARRGGDLRRGDHPHDRVDDGDGDAGAARRRAHVPAERDHVHPRLARARGHPGAHHDRGRDGGRGRLPAGRTPLQGVRARTAPAGGEGGRALVGLGRRRTSCAPGTPGGC